MMPRPPHSTSSAKSTAPSTTEQSSGNSATDYVDVDSPTKVSSEADNEPLTPDLPPGIGSIIRVERGVLRAALQYLWLDGKQPNPEYAERFIRFADDTKLDLDQCFACVRDDGRLFPVALAVPNPGRTAMIFASHLTERGRQAEITALYQYLAGHLDIERIGLAQVLLTRPERRAIPCFEAAGFFKLAELLYMECKISKRSKTGGSSTSAPPSECDWPTGVTLETFASGNETDFKRAIADSYVETLDCPGLCELRTIDDVFLGHQGTGKFDPELWALVRIDGKPAAILLLSAFPDQDGLELTYLGVGAPARGLGLGQRLVTHGLGMVKRAGKSKMTLAVDEKNKPALKLYRRAGFRVTDHRSAVILPVSRQE